MTIGSLMSNQLHKFIKMKRICKILNRFPLSPAIYEGSLKWDSKFSEFFSRFTKEKCLRMLKFEGKFPWIDCVGAII